MLNIFKTLIIVALATVGVWGCAGKHFSEQQWQENITQRIDEWKLEPIKSIRAFDFDSWSSLGDKYLIIRSTPFRPYLIELSYRCHGLDWATALGTKQSLGSSLDAGFDSVFVTEKPHIQCQIRKIYPLTREQDKTLLKLESSTLEQKAEAHDSAS